SRTPARAARSLRRVRSRQAGSRKTAIQSTGAGGPRYPFTASRVILTGLLTAVPHSLEPIMNLELSGKVAIITGASRGIGRAIAQTLADEGMFLTLAARTREQLDDLASALKTRSLVQAVDLREADAPARIVAATVERFGALDLLVNNAGA